LAEFPHMRNVKKFTWPKNRKISSVFIIIEIIISAAWHPILHLTIDKNHIDEIGGTVKNWQ
jgi:hypothetical protein